MILVITRVDDILVAAKPELRREFFDAMGKHMKLKHTGDIVSERKEKYLGDWYEKIENGYQVNLPEEYLQEVLEMMSLEASRPVRTPASADTRPTTNYEKTHWEEPLDAERHHIFRCVVGKLRHAVPRRPDLLFSVHRLSTKLARPLEKHWAWLKRCVRYIQGTKTAYLELQVETTEQIVLECWTDSDFAGDEESRKSVSCAILTMNGAYLYGHSRQQSVIATSSAEAEYYALAGGAVQLLGAKALLEELGVPARAILHCDSSSGRAIARREGFGRTKHIDVKLLWLQDVLAQGR